MAKQPFEKLSGELSVIERAGIRFVMSVLDQVCKVRSSSLTLLDSVISNKLEHKM